MRLCVLLLACSTAPCGNGVVDPGEICDGPRACSELAPTFGGGTAACRACGGWDVSACTLANGDRFELVKPAERDPRFSTARCNDGTPFTFAVRRTPSHDWFIYLEGGVFCDDDSMQCSAREMRLTHTVEVTDGFLGSINRGGFFSSEATVNPDFAGANQVYAYYCSSDFWTGATTERRPSSGDPAQGWYFSGRANVAALFDLLVERYGLDDGDASLRVMLGGGSAGAHGMHFNSQAVLARFPKTLAKKNIKYFGDAPWMIDWDNPSARIVDSDVPDREVWRRSLDFWGGQLDGECVAAAADPIDCWFGTGWYPVVSARLPVFVSQCAVDGSFGIFLHELTLGTPPLMAWRTQSRSELAGAAWLLSGLGMPYHTLAGMDSGLSVGPSGSTLREMVGRFWAGGAPERVEF